MNLVQNNYTIVVAVAVASFSWTYF